MTKETVESILLQDNEQFRILTETLQALTSEVGNLKKAVNSPDSTVLLTRSSQIFRHKLTDRQVYLKNNSVSMHWTEKKKRRRKLFWWYWTRTRAWMVHLWMQIK